MNAPLKKKLSLTNPGVLVLLAAALAGAVSWGAYLYLQKREDSIRNELAAKAAARKTPKLGVVVPKQDSPVGTVLNSNHFVAREIDEDLVSPDVILASQFRDFEGQKLAKSILRGRPLRISDMQLPEIRDVASLLQPGYRAVTIEIDELNSIAKTIRPGHKIDVFLVSRAPKPGTAALSSTEEVQQVRLFMQNMTVLATGKNFHDPRLDPKLAEEMQAPGEIEGASREAKDYDNVTILVTPEQAERLLLGSKMGAYRIALRGSKDSAELQTAALKTSDIDGAPPVKKSGPEIEFIVGGGKGDSMISALPQLAAQPMQAEANKTVAASSGQKTELTKALEILTQKNIAKK